MGAAWLMLIVCCKLKQYFYHICPTDGSIILRTPASPVVEGDNVILCCRGRTGGQLSNMRFFKNGAEILTYNCTYSGQAIMMTVENVTREDEGFYKCASPDREVESPESWLSVRKDRGQSCSQIAFHELINHSDWKMNKFAKYVNCPLGPSENRRASSTGGKNI